MNKKLEETDHMSPSFICRLLGSPAWP